MANLSYSQNSNQGDQSKIKNAILNSNNITTIIYNYGSIGKPNTLPNIADFVWDSLGYMFEFGPIAAAEVKDSSGNILHITDDSFILPTQGTYSPDGTKKWGWHPDSGYSNLNQNYIATKNNPSSWPASWTKFPEFEGDTALNALDEAYYVMDDYSNKKFDYYPFPNDSTKRGLGLRAEVKIFQFSGELKNALIVKYRLTNESPKDLDSVYFGFQGDPHIGGYQDYSDDRIHIYFNNDINDPKYNENNTIYLWDNDFKGMGGIVPGYLNFKFLQTPDNAGLTSFHVKPYSNTTNVPKDSKLMWQWFSGIIDTTSILYSQPGDNILNFGTGPFSLKSGELKYLVLAIFLAHNYQDMLKSSLDIYWDHNWPYISSTPGNSKGNKNYQISLTSPNSGEVSGSANVNWNYSGSDANAKTIIEYSSDMGRNWAVLKSGIDASASSYSWDTKNFKDGVNYLLRIIAYNTSDKRQNYYTVGSGRFTVNNPGDAQPEVQMISNLKDTTITSKDLNLSWLAEDADNSSLNIKLAYSLSKDGMFTTFADSNFNTGTNSFNWDLKNFPNGNGYYIKLTASDGTLDSSVVVGPFNINYFVSSYQTTNFIHTHGNATPDFYIQVVDSSKLTKDTYKITFNSDNQSAKTFSIIDYSNGNKILTDYPLQSGLSTPSFDGIKLLIQDHETGINYSKTGFNRKSLDSTFSVSFPPFLGNPKIALPDNWDIIFNSMDTTSGGNYVNPGDTLLASSGNYLIAPFHIQNTSLNENGTAVAYISPKPQNFTIWRPANYLVLLPDNNEGTTTSYQINFDFSKNEPHAGDTLHIVTYKTLTSNDAFRFAVGSNDIITGIDKSSVPGKYELSQNYPNPFNPTTTIEYQVAKAGHVTLRVFNILGQKVATLVDSYKNAGKHITNFDASQLASGIYIYSLKVNDFTSVKKMVLLK